MSQQELAVQPVSPGVTWIRRHPFAALVALVFIFEWIVIIPGVAGEMGWLPFRVPALLGLIAGWGPGFAAAIVAAALGGKAAVRKLFSRYLIWRVNVGWYLFAIFGTAAFILGGIGLHLLLGGQMPRLPVADAPVWQSAVVFLASVLFGFVANLEDVAWRGVALPLLQPVRGALAASLIIGVLEALTHLPSFFIPGDFRRQTGIWFFVFSIAIVILLTWVFNNTGGSLLLVVLYHATQNAWANLLDTMPPPGPNDLRPFILAAILMVLSAVTVVFVFGPQRLSRKPQSAMPSLAADATASPLAHSDASQPD